MLYLIKEGELASEIEQAEAFKEGVYMAMIKIDKRVNKAGITAPECSPESHESVGPWSSDKVKLPRLVLCLFSGGTTMWTTFCESYEFTVHRSRDFSDIDKFI